MVKFTKLEYNSTEKDGFAVIYLILDGIHTSTAFAIFGHKVGYLRENKKSTFNFFCRML